MGVVSGDRFVDNPHSKTERGAGRLDGPHVANRKAIIRSNSHHALEMVDGRPNLSLCISGVELRPSCRQGGVIRPKPESVSEEPEDDGVVIRITCQLPLLHMPNKAMLEMKRLNCQTISLGYAD